LPKHKGKVLSFSFCAVTFDKKYVLCCSQWAGTVTAKGYVYKKKLMIQRRGAEGVRYLPQGDESVNRGTYFFGDASGAFHFLHFLFGMLTSISRILDASFVVYLNGQLFLSVGTRFLSICTLIYFFCSGK
jgi:hypothetical protein